MKPQILYIFFVSVVLYSCTTIKPAALPEELKLPETVNGNAPVSEPVFKDFFSDKNLQMLLDSAISGNYDLKIAINRIQIAGAQRGMINSRRQPQINAVAGAGVERFGKYTMDGVGNFDTNLSDNIDKNQRIPDPTGDFFLGFTSSWEIDIWGKLKQQRQSAYASYLASEKGRQWLSTQIISRVAENYYALLSLDEQKSILEKNIDLQKRGLDLIETQMLGGRATSLAVRQFKAQLLHNQSSVVRIRQGIIETENQLRLLLGHLPGPINRDTGFLYKPLPDFENKGIPTETLLRRPDIQEAELQLLAAKADVQAARKAFFPALSLNSAIGLNAFKLPLLISGSSLAAGAASSLAAPLLNRGVLKADMKIANASQEAAFYNYQNKILEAFEETATKLKALEHLKEAYALKSEEVKTLEEAVTSATDLYLAGYANYLEVVIAQAGVLQAELEQVYLKEEMYKTIIGIYKSVGGESYN